LFIVFPIIRGGEVVKIKLVMAVLGGQGMVQSGCMPSHRHGS